MSEVAHDDYFQTTLTAYLDRFLNNDIKGYGTFHSYVTGGTALAAGWSKDLRFDPIETKWLKHVQNSLLK